MRLWAASLGLLLALPAQADMYQDASNSKTDTGFRFGSGLFPTYAWRTDTTAAATSGSPVIAVASAVGIYVGDSITAAFAPPTPAGHNAHVVSIAGTSVTMSVNANATGTALPVGFGQDRFWPGATVLSNVVGAQWGLFGNAASGHSTWVDKYFPGSDYRSSQSLFSISNVGTYAALLASRTSDNTGPATSYTIPLGIQVTSDGTGTARPSQGIYVQGTVDPGSTPWQHFNEESTVINNGWTTAAGAVDPYTQNNVPHVINLRLDAAGANKASAAMDITNNGQSYHAGIIIGATALDIAAGRIAPALSMGKCHSIDWYSDPGHAAWRLYSTAVGGSNNAIVLSNDLMSVSGGVYSMAAAAGLGFQARDLAQTWTWFATGNLARLSNGSGEVFTVDLAGDVQAVGTINASSGYKSSGTAGVSCTGAPTAAFRTINGIVTAC
jgi:hypothetical protein